MVQIAISTLFHIEFLLMKKILLVIWMFYKCWNSGITKLQSFSTHSIWILHQNFLHQNDCLIVVQSMISVSQVNLYSIELRHDGKNGRFH